MHRRANRARMAESVGYPSLTPDPGRRDRVPVHEVVIPLVPGVQPLDVVGPHEVFATATVLLAEAAATVGVRFQAADLGYRARLVATQTGPVVGESGLALVATEPLPTSGPHRHAARTRGLRHPRGQPTTRNSSLRWRGGAALRPCGVSMYRGLRPGRPPDSWTDRARPPTGSSHATSPPASATSTDRSTGCTCARDEPGHRRA